MISSICRIHRNVSLFKIKFLKVFLRCQEMKKKQIFALWIKVNDGK